MKGFLTFIALLVGSVVVFVLTRPRMTDHEKLKKRHEISRRFYGKPDGKIRNPRNRRQD